MTRDTRPERRVFLAKTSAIVAAQTFSALPLDAAFAAVGRLTDLSAVEAVAAMRAGEITSEEYAGALLDRCESLKSLNAFISQDRETVLEAARNADKARMAGKKTGALHGLPVPVKDSINTKDLPTTGGTPALRNFRPQHDAPVVGAMLRAGAIVLGKTNIHELSYGWTSSNEAFGPVHNPYDPTRIPGGSSGGTAVAVATGMAPAGLAEDTCGSIRVPAALSGIAGLRPTTGRYPQQGVIPITPKFDTVGPHARTVPDLILLDTVITRDSVPVQTPRLEGLRIGVPRAYFWENLDSEVEKIAEDALRRLRDAGVTLVDTDVPDIGKLTGACNFAIILYETMPSLSRYLEEHNVGITARQLIESASPGIRAVFEQLVMEGGPNAVPKAAYDEAVKIHWPAAQAAYRNYFKQNGVVAAVFPTTPLPATPIGEDAEVEIKGQKMPFFFAISRNIAPGNTAGIPGLVLPAGLTSLGLPVGVEFDGPQWRDRELLGLGIALERALGPIPTPQV